MLYLLEDIEYTYLKTEFHKSFPSQDAKRESRVEVQAGRSNYQHDHQQKVSSSRIERLLSTERRLEQEEHDGSLQ